MGAPYLPTCRYLYKTVSFLKLIRQHKLSILVKKSYGQLLAKSVLDNSSNVAIDEQ
jgi:hypothetical protein